MIIDGSEFTFIALPKMQMLDASLLESLCLTEPWTSIEACFAAFDRWPEGDGTPECLDSNTSLDVARDIVMLHLRMERAMLSGQLQSKRGCSIHYKNAIVFYVTPESFANWLHSIGFSRDTLLYRHYCLSTPQPPSPRMRNNATMADVPQERIDEILSVYNTPGNKVRWGRASIIAHLATSFMKHQIETRNCKCRHDKLAAFTYYKYNWYDRPLVEYDKNAGIFDDLKQIALSIVPPERRFGWRDENGVQRFKNEACKCEIPDHREIALPRKPKRVLS
ncbi:MAG: hypothetical protein PHY09_06760 [Desulfuromonadaceae bacterium]|nr:hypothetical protein [Desulfuromonadaceae bacterium]MDD5104779.1 hypothetical protein [Desulfuromonadaceae bacterium]